MRIETEQASISLSGKDIVKEVSVKVDTGQVVGLFGPNGSGKSTLLKGIYRTLKLQKGVVYLDGKDMRQMKGRQIARMLGVVTQFTTLSFDFSVEEMVLMGRSPHKKAFDRDSVSDFEIVRRCLKQVEMDGFAGRKFLTLSGGEKQRILLARALAQETEMLILDEPTNHLDVKYQLQTMDIIRSLGKGVLLALHDLNMAFAYCDYVYVLKDGKVAAEGTPDAVITETLIRDVYEAESRIYRNPVTGLPNIVFLSGGMKQNENSDCELS